MTFRTGVLGLVLLVCPATVAAQVDDAVHDSAATFPTPGERKGWFAPTTPLEAATWLGELALANERLVLDTLALAPGGAVEPDSVIPVLLAMVRRPPVAEERIRVLILSGQRGDEPSGPEVSLEVIRDLTTGGLEPLLEHLEVAVVPTANPWGVLWWVAGEPGGVDPSRDHATLASVASRGIHDLVSRWKPHVVIELREIGPVIYRIQAGLPTHPNADPRLTRFGRFYLLPYLANELTRASVAFREYVAVEPEMGGRTPLIGGEAALPSDAYFTPGSMRADRARNGLALSGSLPVMLAVASLEGVEGLVSRVALMHTALRALLEVTAGQRGPLRDLAMSVRSLPPSESTVLSLRARFERDDRSPALSWLVWDERGDMEHQTTERWRPVVRRILALPLPAAWAVQADATEWADLLLAHGFRLERLRRAARIEVGAYPVGVSRRVDDELVADLPRDAAMDASTLIVRGERELPAGTWIVRSDQAGARLLFTLIEPWSQDAPLTREHGRSPDGEFLYPVYRLDAAALDRLRTEPLNRSGRPETGPG